MPYRMPPEWAPHDRCWMAWPCRSGMWADSAATEQSYADVAHAIRRYEPVTMLVPPALTKRASSVLGSDIDILELPVDDSWTRDTGPNFVINDEGKLAGVCFRFNAWGGKYTPYDQDALVAQRILEHLGIPVLHSDLVAEGGGLCVDGEGTLLTTDTCFPNRNRNPDWNRQEIAAELQSQLGVDKVIWLPGDPLDNETDGHVDGLAAFVAPGKVALEAATDDQRIPYLAALRAAVEATTDAQGRRLEIIEIPEADCSLASNDRFCLSYVNFYIANGAVIAPSYGVDTDNIAKERLQSCFPEHEVELVPIAHIAEGGGGIHCITQQQPAIS